MGVVMIKDSLWKKAFLFKKAKMWKYLEESDIFAVQLSSGEYGYCSVTGRIGQHFALIVYLGDKGLRSCYSVMASGDMCDSDALFAGVEQYCLQCTLESRNYTDEMQLPELRAYAKKNQIRLGGEAGYPNLVRFYPYRVPWPVNDEEAVLLEEALDAALWLNEKLGRRKDKKAAMLELGFDGEYIELKENVPLIIKKDGEYEAGLLELKKCSPMIFYSPQMPSREKLKALKNTRGLKKNSLDVTLRPMNSALEGTEGDDAAPFIPPVLFASNHKNGQLLKPLFVEGAEETCYDAALDAFTDQLLENKPAEIFTASERTYQFLDDFCRSAGISLYKEYGLYHHDRVIQEFMYNFNHPMKMFHESGLIGQLMQLSDDELANLPPQFLRLLMEPAVLNALPAELRKKLLNMMS